MPRRAIECHAMPSRAHTHTNTHKHTHTHTHTHTNRHTRTHTHSHQHSRQEGMCMQKHTHAETYAHMRTEMHTLMSAHMYERMSAHYFISIRTALYRTDSHRSESRHIASIRNDSQGLTARLSGLLNFAYYDHFPPSSLLFSSLGFTYFTYFPYCLRASS